jgi:virulence-associated protein VagC
MATVKFFKHRGSQAVCLPKAFHFEGTEVVIEKHGDVVILKPKPKRRPRFKTLGDVARYMAKKYPGAADFPDIPRPKEHERPILEW